MTAPAASRGRPIFAVGAVVVILALVVLGVVGVEQALAARPPSGYQVTIVRIARQFGLAPARIPFAGARAGRTGTPTDGGQGARFGGGLQLAAASTALGISTDQLQQELANASLQQVAQQHGVAPSAVSDAMKAAGNQQLDQAVSDGQLSADAAAQRKVQSAQRIDQLMTQTAPLAGQQRGAGSRTPSATPVPASPVTSWTAACRRP